MIVGEHAAVDDRARHLGQRVVRMPAVQPGGHARRAQLRIEEGGVRGKTACGVRIGVLGHEFHVGPDIGRLGAGGALEIGARDLVQTHGELECRDAGERGGQMIDGVIRHGLRAVAAPVVHLELEVQIYLFARLNVP